MLYIEYGYSAPSNTSTGNLANCTNPSANICYRWVKMMDFASGFIPTSTFIFSIDVLDPSGFEGLCN